MDARLAREWGKQGIRDGETPHSLGGIGKINKPPMFPRDSTGKERD